MIKAHPSEHWQWGCAGGVKIAPPAFVTPNSRPMGTSPASARFWHVPQLPG
jgi:hypothetical protein